MVAKMSKSKLKRQADRLRKVAGPSLIDDNDENESDFEMEEEKEGIMPVARSDDEGNDSDRELQIALESGLLKKDRLNILVREGEQRRKIFKGPELKACAAELTKALPWMETLDVTSPSGVTEDIAKDDFQREIQFYKQAEHAAKTAVQRLQQMGVKVFRAKDYYAEMAKSDSHMQKVRKRLLDVQQSKDKAETIKRLREEKRFASKVQKEVLAKRQDEKKKLTEAVKKHKKGMKGQLEDMLNNARRMNLDQDEEDRLVQHRGGSSAEMNRSNRNISREARDKKFGYGGHKHAKTNDKNSFDDVFAHPRALRKGGAGGAGGRGGRKGRQGAKGRR